MSSRKAPRIVAVLAAIAVAVLGATVTAPAPASASPSTQYRVVCYTTAYAGPFAGYVNQAAYVWNASTTQVDLVQCGTNLVVYWTYGGGSYAVRYSLGNGYVVIDYYQAQVYSPLRIMTHEIGHILGLNDNYNGDCSLLMSGGSAGPACTNPWPRWDEAATVDYYFSFGFASNGTQVFRDSWPAPAKVGAPS